MLQIYLVPYVFCSSLEDSCSIHSSNIFFQFSIFFLQIVYIYCDIKSVNNKHNFKNSITLFEEYILLITFFYLRIFVFRVFYQMKNNVASRFRSFRLSANYVLIVPYVSLRFFITIILQYM